MKWYAPSASLHELEEVPGGLGVNRFGGVSQKMLSTPAKRMAQKPFCLPLAFDYTGPVQFKGSPFQQLPRARGSSLAHDWTGAASDSFNFSV